MHTNNGNNININHNNLSNFTNINNHSFNDQSEYKIKIKKPFNKNYINSIQNANNYNLMN
jgi:hypothetical protein